MTDEILQYFCYDLEKITQVYTPFQAKDLIETFYGKGIANRFTTVAKNTINSAFAQNPLISRKPLQSMVELAQTPDAELRKYSSMTGGVTLDLINRGLFELAKLG